MGNSNAEKVYISYARAAEHSLIRKLISYNQDVLHNHWIIVYDENRSKDESSLKGFEKTLAGADRILIFLSQEYFKSIACQTELGDLYKKGADRLLPVPVLVGTTMPSADDELKIIRYWEREGQQCQKKGERKAAEERFGIARQLPVLFAWLLGEYDYKMKRYDTLFTIIEEQDNKVCQKVFNTLKTKKKLRYTFFPADKKRERIQSRINQEINQVPSDKLVSWLKSFAAELGTTKKELAGFLASSSDWAGIEKVLIAFDTWLLNLTKYITPSRESEFLAKIVKTILGWFLLNVFDNRRLHILTHHLNHKQDSANLELLQESESCFQVLTSALVVLPALFFYRRQEQDSTPGFTGKGKLILTESGIRTENCADKTGRDLDWMHLFTDLQSQNTDLAGEYGSRDALEGSLGVEFRKNAYYLQAEKTFLDPLAEEQDICRLLGKKFPELTQIVSDSSEQAYRVRKYLIDGLNIGALDRYIRNIYGHLESLLRREQ
jgi:hypothetical protein